MFNLEADVENTANEIRHRFRDRKAQQLKKPYRPASRFDSPETWAKAAEICIRLGADPESFVAAAFVNCTVPGGPFPQQMNSVAAERWYKDYAGSLKARGSGDDDIDILPIEAELDLLMRHVYSWSVQSGDYMKALRNPFIWHFPAFARVILEPNDPAILATFGRDAYIQLTSNPKLIEMLKKSGYDLSFMERFR